jgi:hypothetical protein
MIRLSSIRIPRTFSRSCAVPYKRRTMTSNLAVERAKIVDQVKIDILSKTQNVDNAAKMKEISRTFICKLDISRLFREWMAS